MRILAVDDDRAYVRFVHFLLKQAGFDVVSATSGNEALEVLRNDPSIGLVLMDLQMPEMDGIATVRRLREIADPTLFAILLTAHDEHDIRLNALENGLDDFLPKTAAAAEIVAKVRNAARRLMLERRLHLENQQLHELANTDELTGIGNRRALFTAADVMLATSKRVSVAIFDIDRFKEINDAHGHGFGDQVLAAVAATLKANTRVGDLLARYGGDEFVLLLPATMEREARLMATRIRKAVAELEWQRWSLDKPIHVSVSVGVSTSTANALTATELINKADAELLRVKRHLREASSRGRPRRRKAAQATLRPE